MPFPLDTQPDHIYEGVAKEIPPGSHASYPGVNSCLTVTLKLADGAVLASHLAFVPAADHLPAKELLARLDELRAGRQVVKVLVMGDIGTSDANDDASYAEWNTEMLGAGASFQGAGMITCMIGLHFNCDNAWYEVLSEKNDYYEIDNDEDMTIYRNGELIELASENRAFSDDFRLEHLAGAGVEYHAPVVDDELEAEFDVKPTGRAT